MIIGIDPGANGAAALIDTAGNIVDVIEFKKNSELDIAEWFIEFSQDENIFAYIENVHAMPKQGVTSTFKFGCAYGFLLAVLTTVKIPYEKVTPNTWQKYLKCQSGGNKNVTKAKAQQLFPKQKINHAVADAILIAEYGRRNKK